MEVTGCNYVTLLRSFINFDVDTLRTTSYKYFGLDGPFADDAFETNLKKYVTLLRFWLQVQQLVHL